MLTLNAPVPELQVSTWLNTPHPISLADLKGRVVVLHAFQMLCPGCVSHALPQATAIRNAFSEKDVTVIGIHTVFEHHAAMNPQALKAFLHEYKIRFPIGIDTADRNSDIPLTMQAYGMRGTPSLILIDRAGLLRQHHFGRLDDLRVGALIGQLLAEDYSTEQIGDQTESKNTAQGCDEFSCTI